jgi:hypothetical protein
MVTTFIAHTPPVRIERPRKALSKLVAPGDIKTPLRTITPTAIIPWAGTVEQRPCIDSSEDREILVLISAILLVFVLPAVLTLVYLVFNPDALMFEITPKYDFSLWQLGDPVKPMGSRGPPIGQ